MNWLCASTEAAAGDDKLSPKLTPESRRARRVDRRRKRAFPLSKHIHTHVHVQGGEKSIEKFVNPRLDFLKFSISKSFILLTNQRINGRRYVHS